MAISLTDLTIEHREISLKNRPNQIYSISPKGTVPVLYLSKDLVIDESLDIMKWCFKDQIPDFILYDPDHLIHKNDDMFKFYLDRYKYHDRYPENNQLYYRDKCDEFLSMLENKLKVSPYIYSDMLGFVDLCIFPFVRQFNNVDESYLLDKYPLINKWYMSIMHSQHFQSVMKKYKFWNVDNKPLIINYNNTLKNRGNV